MSGPYQSTPSLFSAKKQLIATASSSRKPSSSPNKLMSKLEVKFSKLKVTSPKLLARTKSNNPTSSSITSSVPNLTAFVTAHRRSRLISTSSDESNEREIDIINEPEPEKATSSGEESNEKTELDTCAICMDDCVEPKKLSKCDHTFCKECIDQYFRTVKPQCPCCFTIYGEIRGNQPENGRMTHNTSSRPLPGFENSSSGTIKITYTFPNGIQNESHPNPGMPYHGTTRYAYLPDNTEGRHVLRLLEKAFKVRQVFTVGQSRTTGQDNVVTWNDIHHKTNATGGMENFGFPDKTYLNRVQQELAAKGIV